MERLLGKISYNSLTARDCLALNRSLNAIAPVKALLESVDVAPLNALAHTMAPLDSLCELLEKAINPDAPLTLQRGRLYSSPASTPSWTNTGTPPPTANSGCWIWKPPSGKRPASRTCGFSTTGCSATISRSPRAIWI